ncbi:MAG: hypothetical protein HRU38_03865 [Saccharospirillaceae bacterium]|nr:hypothetical protein [Pseudomonadales bacterium]NRB77801.1 hypothetical protein [Saccharospirillaceae bacterium]
MNHTVEVAPFTIKPNITMAELIEKANYIQESFIAKQPGFICRNLTKKSDNEYADILIWQSNEQAQAASKLAMQSPICTQYFELMLMDETTTLGFEHLEIIKSWGNQ